MTLLLRYCTAKDANREGHETAKDAKDTNSVSFEF
jgi:hypothetical protein